MANRKPLWINIDSAGEPTELQEFQAGDAVSPADGGTGLTGITSAYMIYASATDTYSTFLTRTYGRGLLSSSTATSARTLLGVTKGTADGDVVEVQTGGKLPVLDGDNLTFPSEVGTIKFWSGSIASIPAKYQICDGTNSTPDLRDKFVVGAGTTYAVGDTGGATTHNHAITVDNTTLTISQMPSHNHGQSANGSNWVSGSASGSTFAGLENLNFNSATNKQNLTTNTGGGSGHNHSASSANASSLPPYYALAYIMRVTP